MTEKENLSPVYSLNDRLYFGNFAVYKRIITAYFQHPLLKKTVCHKFYIATLERHTDLKEFQKRVKNFGHVIDKTDLTDELRLFNPEPKVRATYFFFEIWDDKKRLPLYYAANYTRDSYVDDFVSPTDAKSKIWRNYIEACRDEISLCIYEQSFHPSCMYELSSFFHEFGFALHEVLDKENPERDDEPIDPAWLESFKRDFKRYKEPAMRNYALAVLDSIYKKAYQDQETTQCQFCGRYIWYVKNKRFCSLKYEKRDCAKKARNKRYYAQKGRQRLDVYRKSTKELRTFYKEKNIRK